MYMFEDVTNCMKSLLETKDGLSIQRLITGVGSGLCFGSKRACPAWPGSCLVRARILVR